MLILKAYINEREIDEIWVHNVGKVPVMDGVATDTYEYRIRKPKGYDHIPIYHRRSDGWSPLTVYALDIIRKEGKKDA